MPPPLIILCWWPSDYVHPCTLDHVSSPWHTETSAHIAIVVTSELMFEQYSVPSLAYCVDSVMSFYHNNEPFNNSPFAKDGLVVSFNTASTSVVPILSGKGLMSHAKRYVWRECWDMFIFRPDMYTQNTMGWFSVCGISPQAYPTEISRFPHTGHFSSMQCKSLPHPIYIMCWWLSSGSFKTFANSLLTTLDSFARWKIHSTSEHLSESFNFRLSSRLLKRRPRRS